MAYDLTSSIWRGAPSLCLDNNLEVCDFLSKDSLKEPNVVKANGLYDVDKAPNTILSKFCNFANSRQTLR